MHALTTIPFAALFVALLAARAALLQNRCLHRFRKAGAASARHAKPLDELKLAETRSFRWLVARGVIQPADQDRWFLSPERAAAFVSLRRRIAFSALALSVAGVLAVWWAAGG